MIPNKWTHPKVLCCVCWRRMVFVDFTRSRQVCGTCETEADGTPNPILKKAA